MLVFIGFPHLVSYYLRKGRPTICLPFFITTSIYLYSMLPVNSGKYLFLWLFYSQKSIQFFRLNKRLSAMNVEHIGLSYLLVLFIDRAYSLVQTRQELFDVGISVLQAQVIQNISEIPRVKLRVRYIILNSDFDSVFINPQITLNPP